MASPGHEPVSNTGRQELDRALPESRVAPLTSRVSLPGYQRPTQRRSRRPARESIGEESTLATAALEALTDVAAASFGSSAINIDTLVMEAVIGEDDRKRVSADLMTRNPWRQICALRIVSQTERTFVGTGWFIAPGVLATAGHCVFLQDEGGWPKSIRVIPAKNGADQPFGILTANRFASVKGWVNQRKRDFDYGVIFLDDPSVGNKVGNFAVRAPDVRVLKGSDAQISGYPADRARAEFQYFHLRPMIDVTDTRLVYDIDTFGGQSGSPIWQDTHENSLIAVGIHTTGGVSSNSGTRITDDVLENLERWTTEGI